MENIILYIIALFAGIGTTVSFIPQVLIVWKLKSVAELSLYMFIIHFTGVLLWIIYYIFKKNFIIILFNLITSILCLSLFVAFYKFKIKEENLSHNQIQLTF